MYLAGVDLYDIMKVTGHTTPAMLKKYIKADSLKVVEKLTGVLFCSCRNQSLNI